jgi:hypothetical protein
MTDLLRPLYKALRRHKIYKLALPDSSMCPGALISSSGEVIQHLTDLHLYEKTAFDSFGKVTLSEPVKSDIVLDVMTQKVSVGAEVGVGVANLVSVRAGVEHADSVTMEISGVHKRFLQAGEALGRPSLLESGDYVSLLNRNLEFTPLEVYLPLLKRRIAGWPATRAVDIAVAMVYIDSIDFTFNTATDVGIEAELEVAVPVDVSAGVSVSHEGGSTVRWNCGLTLPIGFTACRYAWSGRKFVSSIY